MACRAGGGGLLAIASGGEMAERDTDLGIVDVMGGGTYLANMEKRPARSARVIPVRM